MPDLDFNNRFFVDNLKLAKKFGAGFIAIPKQPTEFKETVKPQVSSESAKQVDETCQKEEAASISTKQVDELCQKDEAATTNVTNEPVSAPKKEHPPTKEDQLVQARRDRYQRHDPCQQ